MRHIRDYKKIPAVERYVSVTDERYKLISLWLNDWFVLPSPAFCLFVRCFVLSGPLLRIDEFLKERCTEWRIWRSRVLWRSWWIRD